MVEFSLWDIARHLLLALRWTAGLSLIAFVGGGAVGLALLVARTARWPGAQRGVALYVQLFQGTPLLMQLFLTYFSLAMSFGEQLRHVILPQAARMAIAPTVGFLVQVIKGTALASVIGSVEVTKAGQMIANATYQPFLVYSCVGLMYFVLCFLLSWWSRRIERGLRPKP